MKREWRDALTALQQNCEQGEQIYQALVEECSEDTHIIVSANHIGDTVYVAAYIKAYKEEYHCSKVLLVVTDYLVELGEMFPSIDMVLGITKEEMNYYIKNNPLIFHQIFIFLCIKFFILFVTKKYKFLVGDQVKRWTTLERA